MHNLPHQNFLQTALMSCLIFGAASGVAMAQDVAESAASDVMPAAVADAAAIQQTTRQGGLEIAKEAALAAADYFAEGNYEKSVAKYLEAIDALTQSNSEAIPPEYVAEQLEIARKSLANAYSQWSQQLFYAAEKSANLGLYDDAIEKCKEAIEIYPPAKENMEEAISRYTSMRDAAQFKADTSLSKLDVEAPNREYKISLLLAQGDVLYRENRFDKAQEKFQEVLSLDPYNSSAIDYQRKIYLKMKSLATPLREVTALERLVEVSWNSIQPIATTDASTGEDVTDVIIKIDSTKDIQKKLSDIQIPHLSFNQDPIDSVVQNLRRISRDYDTQDHQGVNFVLRFSAPDYQSIYGAPKVSPESQGGMGGMGMLSGDPDLPRPGAQGGNDPMARFRQPQRAANTGAANPGGFRPGDPDAIAAANAAANDPMARFRQGGMNGGMGMNNGMNGGMGMNGDMYLDGQFPMDGQQEFMEEPKEEYLITVDLDNVTLAEAIDQICRSADLQYRVEEHVIVIAAPDVPLDDFETTIYPIEKEALELLGSEITPDAVRQYFVDRGVPFPEGAKCVFDDFISRLIVTNTPKNLDLVAQIVNEMNVIDPMVLINVKFVEVAANDMQELGFEYLFSRPSKTREGSNPQGSLSNLLQTMPSTMYSPAFTDKDGVTYFQANESFTVFTESVPGADGGSGSSTNGGMGIITEKPTVDSMFTIKKGEYFSFPTDADSVSYFYMPVSDKSRTITFGANSPLVRNAYSDPLAFGADGAVDDTLMEWSHTGSKGYSYNAKLHALDQADTSEILTSPRVLAMNGEQATIRMVTEKYYPDSWDECELETVSSGNKTWVVFTPSIPDVGDATEEGIMLSVRPQVDDNFSITLSLAPTIQNMVGWVDYSYEIPLTDDNGNIAYFPNILKMPILEVRSLQTTVMSYDGQTVVLGGIINDTVSAVEDQYPILGDLPLVGRLFQSKGRSSKKVNLLVFLTNTLVNPDGTPLRENEARGVPVIK